MPRSSVQASPRPFSSQASCRQILARAQRRIDERGRPRFEASRAESDEVARRFFAAVDGGDLDGLLQVLAPDVTASGDGGGKAWALATLLRGADRVARFWVGGQKEGVTIALDVADGQVQAIHSVVNPDKLAHLGPVSDMALRPG